MYQLFLLYNVYGDATYFFATLFSNQKSWALQGVRRRLLLLLTAVVPPADAARLSSNAGG